MVDQLKAVGADVWFAEYEVLTKNYDTFVKELEESLDKALNTCTHAVMFTNSVW